LHLRRAFLLFAIVLGLAALATALSQPQRREAGERSAPPARKQPTARHLPSGSPVRLRLSDAGRPKTRRLASGRPAQLSVEVSEPGLVEVAGLGLTADAEPLTPARFDLLVARPGSYPVEFAPAAGGERERVGVLRVRPPT
jgi:hypothetical protein